MLPRQASLVPGPARVISAFICFGVRFCASSRIRKRLRKVRPRMKFSERILIRLRNRSLVAARPQLPPSWDPVSTSRLSMSAPIHGSIFSFSVPGRKPWMGALMDNLEVLTGSQEGGEDGAVDGCAHGQPRGAHRVPGAHP